MTTMVRPTTCARCGSRSMARDIGGRLCLMCGHEPDVAPDYSLSALIPDGVDLDPEPPRRQRAQRGVCGQCGWGWASTAHHRICRGVELLSDADARLLDWLRWRPGAETTDAASYMSELTHRAYSRLRQLSERGLVSKETVGPQGQRRTRWTAVPNSARRMTGADVEQAMRRARETAS